MLSPADRDLTRRDRALSGLAVLLDPEALGAALYDALAGPQVADVSVSYLRYKPGMNCLARFSASIDGALYDGYAKAYAPDAREKLAKARERPVAPLPFGPGRISLEDCLIEVVFYPNDNKLKSLERLDDPQARATLLGRRLLASQPALRDASLSRLQYKPERRYVARLDVDDQPRAALRLYSRREYSALPHAVAEWAGTDVLRLPRLIRRSDRRSMLAYAWVPGQPLSILLSGAGHATQLLEQTGAALAGLHAQPALSLPPYRPVHNQDRLGVLARSIGALCPSLNEQVHRLAGRLQEATRRPSRLTPIHGDFHPRQVLVDGCRVAIIDLDEVRIDNPAADLGLFLAHLERAALHGQLSVDWAGTLAEALLAGYQSVHPLPSSAEIAGFTAYGLLSLAPHHFRNREPDWPGRTGATVRRAGEVLEHGLARARRDRVSI